MDADEIVERCTAQYELWEAVYEMLGIPFEYRAPTTDELKLYIILYAEKYLKQVDNSKKSCYNININWAIKHNKGEKHDKDQSNN